MTAKTLYGFRWCQLRDESSLAWNSVLTAVESIVVLCGTGAWYFRKVARTFVDVI